MSTRPNDPAPAGHPLGSALDRFRAATPWSPYAFEPGRARKAAGSTSAAELFDDASAMRAWIDRAHTARMRTHGAVPVRIAAAAVLADLAHLAGWVGGALLHRERRIPLADPESMLVEMDDSGEITAVVITDGRFACLLDDAAAGHPDAVIVADSSALASLLRERAVQLARRFEPAVTRTMRFGARARWGAVSDALDVGPWVASGRNEREGAATAAAILTEAEAPLIAGSRMYCDRDAHGREFYTRDRHFCCYEYLVPSAEACFSCPRTPREERRRRASTWPDGGPPD